MSEQGFFSATVDITYSGFADFDGVRIDGTQTTQSDSSGDGHMSGSVAFVIQGQVPGVAAPAPITGSVSYGQGGGDSLTITNGEASGGRYVIALDGGATAKVDPVAPPNPSVADCLGL